MVSQFAALAALDLGAEYTREFRDHYLRRRELMCSRLAGLPQIFTFQVPEAAYFVFAATPNFSDSVALSKKLIESAKVAAVPGVAFGPSGEGHLRFCFGKTDAEITEGFDRLDRHFGEP